jgi:hypothetical protein
MKVLDLIYFLSYKAYIRNDESKLGVFSLLAIWVSILQMIVIYNVVLIINLLADIYSVVYIERDVHIVFFILLIVMNHLYVYTGNRKTKILNRFEYLGREREKRYWYGLVVFFIIMWGLFILLP